MRPSSAPRGRVAALLAALVLVTTVVAGCGDDGEPVTVAIIVGLDAFRGVVDPLDAALAGAGVDGGVRLVEIDLGLAADEVAGGAALDAAVAEALALEPAVVVAVTTPVVRSVLAADPDVPVVFGAVNDPVAVGLVDDLRRPGGRLTGVGTTTGAATLAATARAADARVVGVLTVPDDPVAEAAADQLRGAVDAIGVELVELAVDPAALDRAELRALLARVEAVVLPPAPFVVQVRVAVAEEALAAGVPLGVSLATLRPLPGVMVAVAPDLDRLAAQLARQVVAVIEGVPAGDLAVDAVGLRIAIDLDVADRLGIDPPELVLREADELFRTAPD